MKPIFEENYKKYGRNFEEPTDWHWNGYGHQVAYEAIQKSEVFQRFISASKTNSGEQEESQPAVEELAQ